MALHPDLPEQQDAFFRARQKNINRETGQTLEDVVEAQAAYKREWIKYAFNLPVWIEEPPMGQFSDGSESFMLGFDGIGTSPLA